MSKRQMQNILIVASLPFLVVAWDQLDFSDYLPTLEDRQCEIYHENAHPEAKCDNFGE